MLGNATWSVSFCEEKNIYPCYQIMLLVSNLPLLQLSYLVIMKIVFQFGFEGRSCKIANQMPVFSFILLQSEGFMATTIHFFAVEAHENEKKFFESLKMSINSRSQEF